MGAVVSGPPPPPGGAGATGSGWGSIGTTRTAALVLVRIEEGLLDREVRGGAERGTAIVRARVAQAAVVVKRAPDDVYPAGAVL